MGLFVDCVMVVELRCSLYGCEISEALVELLVCISQYSKLGPDCIEGRSECYDLGLNLGPESSYVFGDSCIAEADECQY